MKKRIKKRYIFLIIVAIYLFPIFIASCTPIFPIALKIGLDKEYKFKDYKINRTFSKGALEDWYSPDEVPISYWSLVGDKKHYNLLDYIQFHKEINGIDYEYSIYNPILIVDKGIIGRSVIKKYDKSKINKDSLSEYSILNLIEREDINYYMYWKSMSWREQNIYYNKKSFNNKAKIIKNKNSVAIIYPIEYYGKAFGPNYDAGPIIPTPVCCKYGQNIIIFQDKTVIQVHASSQEKENLIQKNVNFTNHLLSELNKAEKDKNYKINLVNYKDE